MNKAVIKLTSTNKVLYFKYLPRTTTMSLALNGEQAISSMSSLKIAQDYITVNQETKTEEVAFLCHCQCY